jgi:hypothetical protein
MIQKTGQNMVDDCRQRKLSAQKPEDMLKLGSVASMGLPKYLLIFFSIRNRRKSDTDQGFDIRESRAADTGFCATGSYGEYAAAVL